MEVVPFFDGDIEDVVDVESFQRRYWERRTQVWEEHISSIEDVPDVGWDGALCLPIECVGDEVFFEECAASLLKLEMRFPEVG